MIAYFSKEWTWLYSETDFDENMIGTYGASKSLMGGLINTEATCSAIESLPISRFFINDNGPKEITREQALYGYKLFSERYRNTNQGVKRNK